MNTLQVLEASGLFESRSEIRNQVKNKSVKINGLTVEDLNETIEAGDFIPFGFRPGGLELIRKHGRVFLIVGKGKKDRTLLRVVGEEIENITDNWENWQKVFD